MATTPRKGLPYLYATWLAKRLAGETQCAWQLGFQARYKFERAASDFNLAAWSADHDALVAKRAEELEAAGYTVSVENDNYFQVKGSSALVAGKMDLVARKPGYCIVLDGKTGQQRKSDWWQVLLYAIFLPLAWNTGSMRISGEVFYKDGTRIQIEPEEVTEAIRHQVFALIKSVGKDAAWPFPKSPSAKECGWCPISRNDCAERVENKDAAVTTTTLF